MTMDVDSQSPAGWTGAMAGWEWFSSWGHNFISCFSHRRAERSLSAYPQLMPLPNPPLHAASVIPDSGSGILVPLQIETCTKLRPRQCFLCSPSFSNVCQLLKPFFAVAGRNYSEQMGSLSQLTQWSQSSSLFQLSISSTSLIPVHCEDGDVLNQRCFWEMPRWMFILCVRLTPADASAPLPFSSKRCWKFPPLSGELLLFSPATNTFPERVSEMSCSLSLGVAPLPWSSAIAVTRAGDKGGD